MSRPAECPNYDAGDSHQELEAYEPLNPESYPLRAHHIHTFARYAELGVEATDEGHIASSQNQEDGPISGPAYIRDIFGDTEAEKRRVIDKHGRIFNAFQRLSPETKVILTRQRDELCDACIHGNHCPEMIGDWLEMQNFMRHADQISRIRNEKRGSSYHEEWSEEGVLEAVHTTKQRVEEVIARLIEVAEIRRSRQRR